METKIFEVRDRMTFIPVMGMKLSAECERESRLLAQVGWGSFPQRNSHIMLVRLDGMRNAPANFDPFEWGDRTFQVAHKHIEQNFHALETGAVVDVEFLLGETDTIKEPQ